MTRAKLLRDFATDAADDACDAISRSIDIARDLGTEWPMLSVIVCVQGRPIMHEMLATGVKVARLKGVIRIFLTAELAR